MMQSWVGAQRRWIGAALVLPAGPISFHNGAGSIDLVADVAGWYGPFGP